MVAESSAAHSSKQFEDHVIDVCGHFKLKGAEAAIEHLKTLISKLVHVVVVAVD